MRDHLRQGLLGTKPEVSGRIRDGGVVSSDEGSQARRRRVSQGGEELRGRRPWWWLVCVWRAWGR